MSRPYTAFWTLAACTGALLACSGGSEPTSPTSAAALSAVTKTPVTKADAKNEDNIREETCLLIAEDPGPFHGAEGKAIWEINHDRSRDLDVEIEGLTPGLRVVFAVGGRVLGTETVQENGEAGIETETSRGQFVPERVAGLTCEVHTLKEHKLIARGRFGPKV